MSHRFYVAAFFVLTVLACVGTVSCGEPIPSITSMCKSDSDCGTNRLCIGEICVSNGLASTNPTEFDNSNKDSGTPDDPPKVCPSSCTQDTDCFASGCGNKTQCNRGTCRFPQRCPASCGSGADCSGCTGKTACINSQCAEPPPSCKKDSDCGTRKICEKGFCQDGCRKDDDCRGDDEDCRNKVCVRTCEENSDCPQGQRCKRKICQQ